MIDATKRAVVLEDDEGVRRLLELVLSTEGWGCASGESLEDVVGDLAGADLILLDHHLPGMTGLEVLAALRDLGVGVPVVMLTGDPHARAQAERLGVDRFLLKPFDFTDLLDALRDVAATADRLELDLRDGVDDGAELPWFASR